MTEFEKLTVEMVAFLRGKYRLDEVTGMYYDVPCLRFRQGKKTIVSINLHKNFYEVQLVLGKAERDNFEAIKEEFSLEIQDLYEKERTLHDGKWLLIRVDNLQTWDEVKKLIMIKKSPNRKPISKETLLYGKCGHRCDLCVHYTRINEEFRDSLIPHLNAVYGENSDWSMRCTGCATSGCHCYAEGAELCEPLQCGPKMKVENCMSCEKYPCEKATVGYRKLEHKNIAADDVTWAILPYVPQQYESEK